MTYQKIGISIKIFESTNHYITWISSRPILVTKYDGNYYAMDAICGHMGCALLERVSGKIAECPAHGAKYDVTTGEKVGEPRVKPESGCEYEKIGTPLKTYKIRETNGFLEVDI